MSRGYHHVTHEEDNEDVEQVTFTCSCCIHYNKPPEGNELGWCDLYDWSAPDENCEDWES